MANDNYDIGVKDEFRGMVQKDGCSQREEHGMASQRDRDKPKSSLPVEKRSESRDSVFSKGVHCTCQFAWDAFNWDDRIRGQNPRDQN